MPAVTEHGLKARPHFRRLAQQLPVPLCKQLRRSSSCVLGTWPRPGTGPSPQGTNTCISKAQTVPTLHRTHACRR
jgi:hypothetical protein